LSIDGSIARGDWRVQAEKEQIAADNKKQAKSMAMGGDRTDAAADDSDDSDDDGIGGGTRSWAKGSGGGGGGGRKSPWAKLVPRPVGDITAAPRPRGPLAFIWLSGFARIMITAWSRRHETLQQPP
jgi:hypothetical protein